MPSAATLTARAPNTAAACAGPAVAGMRRLAGAGEGRDRARGKIDDAHPVVGDIGDEQTLLRRVKCQPVGLDQTRARRRSAIAGEPGAAVAGDGGNDARGAVDPADAVIVAVGDIDVAARGRSRCRRVR